MAGGLPSRPEGRKAEGSTGGMSRPTWVMPEPSPEVVEELRRRFPTVVQLPEEELRSSSEVWLAKGVVVRSLGRRVAVESVVREIRLRGRLAGEVHGFPMDEKLLTLRFSEQEDRDKVLQRPWVVNGQPLAMECWRPRFSPTCNAIQSAVVWVRLPWLPVEYWKEEMVRSIVQPAGDLVCLDECTTNHRRLGFARAAIRISLVRPLRPGVIIGDPSGGWWQRFVYEHLDGICFHCGFFHDTEGGCPAVEKGSSAVLQPSDFTGDPLEEGEGPAGRQELGPWIAAVRKWLPAEFKGKPQSKVDQLAEGPPVSSQQAEEASGKSPLVFEEVPGGGRGSEGWVKPAKVARRRSPPRGPATGTGVGVSSNPFAVLPEGAEKTTAQGEAAHAKRARSPPRSFGTMKGLRKAQATVSASKALVGLVGQPKSKCPSSSRRSEQGDFRFSAGEPMVGSSSAPMEELPLMEHVDVVGRVRLALQEEGELTMEVEHSIEGVLGGDPESHRAEDPSSSTVIYD